MAERFRVCLERAREIVRDGLGEDRDIPCIPEVGASEAELQQLESLLGVALPAEYRQFLTLCRYMTLGPGAEVGGFNYNGISIAVSPWLSDEHRPGVEYLIFADYWRYADGDQLMFDMSDIGRPVIAYLHEHGPLFEFYAPSFSLALWRLVHEVA